MADGQREANTSGHQPQANIHQPHLCRWVGALLALIRPIRPVRVRDLQFLASGHQRSAIRHLPSTDRVRKPAKRPGREPGACGFDSHFGHFDPVVQRHDTSTTYWRRWFDSIRDQSQMGSWSNGKTTTRQAVEPGSTPGESTASFWKAAEYGWPGRIANAVLLHRR